MRFFGHHPQVLRSHIEAPYHQSGDDEFDIKNYLLRMYRVWSQEDNKKKLWDIRKKRLNPVFMAKTANKGIKHVMDFIEGLDVIIIFYRGYNPLDFTKLVG